MKFSLDALVITFVAGCFGLIPLMWQISVTRAQRRDRMTRLSHPRAELELLERLNALQGAVSAGDEAAKRKLDLTISNAISYVMGQYNALAEIAPSKIASSTEVAGKQRSPREISFLRRAFLLYDPDSALGWILHTVFYVVLFVFTSMLIYDLFNPTYDPETGTNEFWYLLIGLTVILGPPLLIVQRIARHHSKPRPAPEEEPKRGFWRRIL